MGCSYSWTSRCYWEPLNSREWSAGGGGRVEGGKVGEVGLGPASSPGQDEKRNSSACPNGDCP